MENKIRVYGKAQNRTALGIMHAYMLMNPDATLEDLREAFPDSLNPDSGVKKNFIYAEEKGTDANWEGFFKADDEVLHTGDGRQVAVVKMWTKPSFERLVAHAAQYGIEVAQFDEAEKGFGRKGGYRLEYLNGWMPPTEKEEPVREEPKKKSKAWLWIILVIIIIAAALAALFDMKKEPEVKVVEKVVEKKVVVRDTVFVEKIAQIQENFNAAHNQLLSEQRAKAAVDFLVHHEGVDSTRLQAVGKGSTEPVDPNSPEANRRTEFKLIR